MKQLAVILLVLSAFLLAIPAVQAIDNSASLAGVRFYPADHIWNVPITTMPVDTKSAGLGTSSWLGMYRGMPYNLVDNTVVHQDVSLLRSWSDHIKYPIPQNPLIEPGGVDKHLLIVDKDDGMFYEFYKASMQTDGTLYAQSGFSFDLNSYALRTNGLTTACEAGLPILPGLVRYDEVSSGVINHALRVSVPATNHSYVWPARANGNDGNTDGRYPAMGQRYRLKASFDTSGYSPQTKVILEALKKYGMMVSGMNGETGFFELTAAPDTRWNTNDLGGLKQVHGSDFEAVDVSSLMINVNSGQARTSTNPIPPAAAFTATPNYLNVQFTSSSTGTAPLTYAWNFGDGSTSTLQNPAHTYAAAGTYSVKLTVTNTAGSNAVTKSVTASAAPAVIPPTAAFTATANYLNVQFTSSSTGTAPLTYAWNFGDGSTSTLQNPAHTYAAAGTYSVKLTVTNSAGSNAVTKSVTASAAPAVIPPTAAFSATANYLNVQFTSSSTGTAPLTYAWNFGDGSTSTLQNPAHTYAAAGTYSVKLTVTNTAGSNAVTKSVTASAAPAVIPPTAAFSATANYLNVQFTSSSTGTAPLTYAWNFGDGSTSTLQNPAHTYAAAGTYSVKLTVTNTAGSNAVTKSVTASAAPVDSEPKIGVYVNGHWYLDSNGDGTWNEAGSDMSYTFLRTGDLPVTGDWNNNGKSEIGIFRPSTHVFYLDYNGNGAWNGSSTDRQYNFGITGDIPIAGDWNNNGKSEIGVFRPSTHMFYLDYNGNGAWNGLGADRSFSFGITGDLPVTGDWNNDGKSEIGVFRPSTHMFYLDYNGNGVWNGPKVDRQYNFGITGDRPVSGDWNNDGKYEIGIFRPSTQMYYQDYNGNGVWNGLEGDRSYAFGITGDTPIAGIW